MLRTRRPTIGPGGEGATSKEWIGSLRGTGIDSKRHHVSPQRVTALDAHRAAKAAVTAPAKHAAAAAGDTAAAAYLHPFAEADQVGHILRAAAHAACAAEAAAGDPGVGLRRVEEAAERATPALVAVLRRYPSAPTGKSRVSILMKLLEATLRTR